MLSLQHRQTDGDLSAALDRPTSHSGADRRPGLAMIVNVLAPYRVHLHRLIAAGIPELKLHTLVTHHPADFQWEFDLPESIHVRFFGSPGDSPVASLFRRPVCEWRKGGRLIEYLKANDIRAVILLGYRHISNLRIIQHCHRSRLPLFIHNDSNIRGDRNMSSLKRLLKKQVYGWWMRRVSGVMSMGELGDQFFLYYGADCDKMYRVPFVPDFESFASVNQARLDQFRRRFGLSPERRYLLFSGRLIELKRVDLIIDAFAQVAAERPEWDLLIVGDGVLANELRRQVPEWLRPRVIWTGFLDRDEPALAYHLAQVSVLASEKDAWGLVIPEAMAAGLVVVSSDVVGAAQDLVEDRHSGRIYPVGNLAELKQAILEVTAADALPRFKQQSQSALNRWREKVDPVAEVRRALAESGVLDARGTDSIIDHAAKPPFRHQLR